MSKARYLENASGACFFSGFMLSKLQYLPFPIVAAILRFVSLGVYLIGYGMWFIASLLQPKHQRKNAKWYGFAMLKDQLLFSSIIGFIATIISLIAVSIPFLFPAAAWLYTLGNIIWAVGEYHKLQNPPEQNTNLYYEKQNAYFKYSLTMTTISLVTAVASTLIIALPLATIPITVFSACICVGLGAFAFENWLVSTFGTHHDLPLNESYNQIKTELGVLYRSPQPKEQPEPYHEKNFFASSSKSKTEMNPNPKNEDSVGHSPYSPL
jgi:hypothetical protein